MSYHQCTSPASSAGSSTNSNSASSLPNNYNNFNSASNHGNHTKNIRPLSINLIDHCLLCLQPEDPQIILQILQSNPKQIVNFQPLVYYLTGIDPTNKDQESELINSKKYFPLISNLPPLCTTCYHILGEIYNLHNQLVEIQMKIMKEVKIARRIVEFTGRDERGGWGGGRLVGSVTVKNQLFRKLGTGMKCLLNREEMEGLRYFLDNFQGLVNEAAIKNKFIFPCPPPPPMDPDMLGGHQTPTPPKSQPSTALMTLSYPVRFSTGSLASPTANEAPDSSCNSTPVHFYKRRRLQRQESGSSPMVTSPPPQSSEKDHSNHGNSYGNHSNRDSAERSISSEMIVVSGIDHNIKYEVEGEGDEDLGEEGEGAEHMFLEEEAEGAYQEEEEEVESINPMVIIKTDLYSDSDNDNEPDEQKPDLVSDLPEEPPGYDHSSIIAPPPSDAPPPPWQRRTQPCDICNLPFYLLNLHQHLHQHLGVNPWICDICHQGYPSRSKLLHHFSESNAGGGGKDCHHNSLWYQENINSHSCSFCGANFSSENQLHWHVFTGHERDTSLEKIWRCKMCLKAYRTKLGLDFHFNVHLHRARKKECCKVLKDFYPPPAMFSSIGRGTCGGSGGGGDGGGELISSPSIVRSHPSSSIDLSCDICGKKCGGSTALLRHVKEVHKGMGKKRPSGGGGGNGGVGGVEGPSSKMSKT